MKKSLLLLLLAFVASAASAATVALAKMQNDTITFYCGDESEANGESVMKVNTSRLAIPFSKYDTWGVTCITIDPSFKQVKPTSTKNLFSTVQHYLSALTSITGLENLNTENVTDMSRMFFSCEKVTALDVSSFNTSKVTDMSSMFYGCKSLTGINVKNFDTKNVTNLSSMFEQCFDLASLDLSSFDTQNVTDLNSMFSNCKSLTSIDVSGFNTQNVTNFSSLFNGCEKLTSLDLSALNTQNLERVSNLCSGCSGLVELNLGKNDFSNANQYFQSFLFTSVGTEDAPCTLFIDPSGDNGFKTSVLGESKQDAQGKDYYKWSSGYFYVEIGTPTAIDQVNVDKKEFDPNAPAFNLQGQRVSGDYRGVVIQNGHKFIRK